MQYALGSNRAEYGKCKQLHIHIRMALYSLGLSFEECKKVRLPKRLEDLENCFSELHRILKLAGRMI